MKIISPKELYKLIESKSNDYQLIDIREDHELKICSIGGLHINMYTVTDNINKISRNKKVIIYCRSGKRSAAIVKLLENNFQFDNIYNLDGGIMKWRDEIDLSLTQY